MAEIKLPTDRRIDSTDTNEFATGLRDEQLLAEDLVVDVPIVDDIPGGVYETGEDDRPLYNESGITDSGL